MPLLQNEICLSQFVTVRHFCCGQQLKLDFPVNLTMKIIIRAIIYIVIIVIFSSCQQKDDAAKELDLTSQQILRISITDRDGKTVDIVDSSDIQFFLAQLRSLPTHTEGMVNNEFSITVYKGFDDVTHKYHVVSLRMGKDCIGPMVPTSDAVTRWYFENDSLYKFISSKLHYPSTQRGKR